VFLGWSVVLPSGVAMLPASFLDVFVRQWGGATCIRVSIWEGIFFIVCGEGEMLMGLVVLVDTCQHGEAGDMGKNPPEDAQHYPFFLICAVWIGLS
jgi:uncharacterized protein (DUF983 family)